MCEGVSAHAAAACLRWSQAVPEEVQVGCQVEFLHTESCQALPREQLESPSLEVFKEQLDVTWGSDLAEKVVSSQTLTTLMVL